MESRKQQLLREGNKELARLIFEKNKTQKILDRLFKDIVIQKEHLNIVEKNYGE